MHSLIEEDVFTVNTLPAPELVELFRIPKYLLKDVYRRSNGLFESKGILDKNGRLKSHRKFVSAR